LNGPLAAFAVNFSAGNGSYGDKINHLWVRAVRSASPASTTTSTSTSSTTSTTFVSGCYTDTGLTVIDTCNNLEWEKKDGADATPGSGTVDAGNLHDVDNHYTWAGLCTLNTSVYCQPNAAAAATCTAQTGVTVGCGECGVGEGTCDVDPNSHGAITTIWDWVNAASFAGHTDWRLATSAGSVSYPTGEPAELESIADLGFVPAIDPIFGPTVESAYWAGSALGHPGRRLDRQFRQRWRGRPDRDVRLLGSGGASWPVRGLMIW
jgi:hypothetical protein